MTDSVKMTMTTTATSNWPPLTTAFCGHHERLEDVMKITHTALLPNQEGLAITARLLCGHITTVTGSRWQVVDWLARNDSQHQGGRR